MNERTYRIDGREVWARCILCGAEIPVLTARTGKPYIVCSCGLQAFFRMAPAIVALEEAALDPDVDDFFLKEVEDAPLAEESAAGSPF